MATLVKERPILFNGEMVHAILDGRKTQTRRVVKRQPSGQTLDNPLGGLWLLKRFGNLLLPRIRDLPMHCPYGQPGELLWVRETWAEDHNPPFKYYRADWQQKGECWEHRSWRHNKKAVIKPRRVKWRPSIHMRRSTSRIVLDILDVRIERLQDISEENAIAEGVEKSDGVCGRNANGSYQTGYSVLGVGTFSTPRNAFSLLWNSINAKRGFGWDVNPWVWVVEFRRIKPCKP